MAGAELLSRWTDAGFGDLLWAGDNWVGRVPFYGRDVRATIGTDREISTRDDQLDAIAVARRLLADVRSAEPELRRQAAEQIAEAVAEQWPDVGLPRTEFAITVVIEAVSLHGSGELHYQSEACFPGKRITVFFDGDLSNVERSIYQVG